MTRLKLGLACIVLIVPAFGQSTGLGLLNGNRSVVDAHNCYPYEGRWSDRLTRALASGFPVGIEQDLAWSVDPRTGKGRAVVSHEAKTNGAEPTLRAYFFEAVRPLIEKALRDEDRSHWPLIILHFDFKDNQPALLHAVWELLVEYEPWLTTTVKADDPQVLQPLDVKPILALTEDSDAQEKVFFNDIAVRGRLLVFGSAHTNVIPGASQSERIHNAATLPPERLLSEAPTNYRRWWNNSWFEVEEGGQSKAGAWTPADNARLKTLVDHAHSLGFWIRFYTLDGFAPAEDQGWGNAYNFGSRAAVSERWKAALNAGVNLVATDQYEDLAGLAKQMPR